MKKVTVITVQPNMTTQELNDFIVKALGNAVIVKIEDVKA